MKPGWITAGIAAAMLTLGLGACGGSSGTSDSSSAHPSAGPAGPPGTLTPPGTRLAPGQTATVSWISSSAVITTKSQKGVKLQVTVEAIEKGKIADLKDDLLNANERRKTPYYVKLKVTTLGTITKKDMKYDEPLFMPAAASTSDNEPEWLQFGTGTFPRCDEIRTPEPFAKGKSFESCLVFLVRGSAPLEMQWPSGPHGPDQETPYGAKPIVWAGS